MMRFPLFGSVCGRKYGITILTVILVCLYDRLLVSAWSGRFVNNVVHESMKVRPASSSSSSSSSSCSSSSLLSRRSAIAGSVTALLWPITLPAWADAEVVDGSRYSNYENRDRKSNKGALIREDYWFMMGKSPPRLLNGPIRQDDPQWNAFGTCETTGGDGASSNSCTYVSLKQRIPIYSKYGFSIALGAKEYSLLGKALQNAANADGPSNGARYWNEAASFVFSATEPSSPPPVVDALLKMVLFASGMLTSPNYSGPNKQLLVARFYANEVGFATKEIQDAIVAQDGRWALSAWEFGKDSWNSYFQVVNSSVAPKVGEKFEPIS